MELQQNDTKFLEDCKKNRLIVEDRKDALSQLDSSIKTELYKLKLEFSQLKTALHNKQVLFSILSGLDGDQTVDKAPSDDEVSAVYTNLRDLKDKLDASRLRTEELCDELEIAHDELKAKLIILEDKLNLIQQKKQKLALLTGGGDKLNELPKLPDICNLNANIKHCKDQNMMVTLAIETTEDNLLMSHDTVQSSHDLIQSITKLRERNIGKRRVSEWCENLINIISSNSYIIDHGLNGNIWSVTMSTPPSQDGNGIQLKIQMTVDWLGDIILKDVQIAGTDIDTSEVVENALCMNNIPGLLTSLHSLVFPNCPLTHEVDTLRKRYAIDWDKGSNYLTVIYGGTVCTLYIHPDYPSTGKVILDEVKGQDNWNLEQLKPEDDGCSLTDWMAHLKQLLDAT